MQIIKNNIREFIKSLGKSTKLLLSIGSPIIAALLAGAVFLRLILIVNGWSFAVAELSEELFKCAADCFAAVYIPAFFVELFSGKYR